jgi:hypothetical protein
MSDRARVHRWAGAAVVLTLLALMGALLPPTPPAAAASVSVTDVRRAGPKLGGRAPYDLFLGPSGLLASTTSHGRRNTVRSTRINYRQGLPRPGKTVTRATSEIGWSLIDNVSGSRAAEGRTMFFPSGGIRLSDGARATGQLPRHQLSAGHVQGELSGPYLYLARSQRRSNAVVVRPNGRTAAPFTWDATGRQAFHGPLWARVSGRTAVVRNVDTRSKKSVTVPVEQVRTVSGVEYDIDRVTFSSVQILGRHLLLSADVTDINGGSGACPAPRDQCPGSQNLWAAFVVVDWTNGDVVNVFGVPGDVRPEALLAEGGAVLGWRSFGPWQTTLALVPNSATTVVPLRSFGGHSYLRGIQNRTVLLTPEKRRFRSRLVTFSAGGLGPQYARLLGSWRTRWDTRSSSWRPEFDFTQGLRRWTLTISRSSGAKVRTLSGRALSGSVRAVWDGRSATGRKVTGKFRWRLSGTTPSGAPVRAVLDGPVRGTVTVP